MRSSLRYDEPFGWWGPVWAPPAPRTVLDLIRDGTLDVQTAGVLWALLARRASLVVAAGPAGAGKTTLLTALLDFLPPGVGRVYVRGCYEPFAFLADPAVGPGRIVLLVNEISAHLPIYLWGPGVRRVFGALGDGFALAATAHATTVEALVGSLAGYPLQVPPSDIAAIHAVVLLDAWIDGGTVRREVRAVVGLAPGPSRAVTVAPLAERPARGAPAALDWGNVGAVLARLTSPAGRDVAAEVGERVAALVALATDPPAGPDVAMVLAGLTERWPRWEPTAPIG